MITNHFFNLIQCYSEQGVCYFRDYSFGIMSSAIVLLLWMLLITYIIGFLLFFSRNAICTCGEHFYFWGFIQSFFWPIVVPYRICRGL